MLSKGHSRLTLVVLSGALIAMAITLCGQAGSGTPSAADQDWAIAIHGGAGNITPAQLSAAGEAAYTHALNEALQAGGRVLAEGGSSLDAVEAAITLLEDSPLFNAGRGAVTTVAGVHELDSSVMEGRARTAGGVAGVRRVRNPLQLARMVMERSPHVLLTGDGAEAFAVEQGVQLVPPEYFRTDGQTAATSGRTPPAMSEDAARYVAATASVLGTVGAVAWDRQGDVAAGTSTGGMSGKRTGRVGDSPIIGAGTYAHNDCGAVSATGHGEFFIRAVVAYDICAISMYTGVPIRDAADQVIMEKLVAMGGDGGVIAIDPQGVTSFSFNSRAMFRGSLNSSGELFVRIFRD